MTTPVCRGPSGLLEFATHCAACLFHTVQHTVSFPDSCSVDNWPVERIKLANAELLKSLRGRANVYAIYVRPAKPKAQWEKMYVGQRKSAYLRERVTQHLIKKSDKTGSTLDAVMDAVSSGSEIGLSLIRVEPESLRLFVEEAIIAGHKNELPWNIWG